MDTRRRHVTRERAEPKQVISMCAAMLRIPNAAPATRQLYIRFHGPPAYFPRTERDIERVFRDFGPIKKVRLLPKGDAAILHFLHTADATSAKDKMHERLLHNTSYSVYYNRTSRLLFFDYLPPNISEENLRKLFIEQFSRFGNLEKIDILEKKGWAFILFQKEADAVRAVQELQNRREGEWKWEIEFYKVPTSPMTLIR